METTEQVQQRRVRRRTSRRSFLVKGAAAGVGTVGAGWLLTDASPAFASATVGTAIAMSATADRTAGKRRRRME